MPAPAARATALLKPISADRFNHPQARHLLLRAGFGGSLQQIDELAAMGPQAAVDHLLDFPPPPPNANEPFRGDIIVERTKQERDQIRRARQQGDENTLAEFRKRRQTMQGDDRKQFAQLQRWWINRLIDSPHPLQEKMTLFWHGHLPTSYRTIENSYHLFMQNQLYRRHAVGRFDALLHEIIRDPAMLVYLDNSRSRKKNPNENLARELMELFSLGVGNYGERDIKEGARALTGYTFEGNRFVLRQDWHDEDTKTILGVRGQLNGDDFVSAILRQKACSKRIAFKLYRFFVADIPDDLGEAPDDAQTVITALALRLHRKRYEIKPMLRELFLSEHFYDSANMDSKIKSPVELIVGAIRSFGLPKRKVWTLPYLLERMGQYLFYPPSVAGWEGGRSWINTSTLFTRQNALLYLLIGDQPKHKRGRNPFDSRTIVRAKDRRDADSFSQALLSHALGTNGVPTHPIGAQRLAVLKHFIEETGDKLTFDNSQGMFALIAAMPEFQLC